MTCLVAGPPPAGAAAPDPTRPAAAEAGLVDRLVQAMTLDEKLGMVNGWPDGVTPPPTTDRLIGVGFIPGVPRLGVPALTFTDGPAGVRMNLPTTAMPAPVALAATFSADLAQRYGQVLGRDSRARDQDVIFAPMLNLVRVPQAGRNFETLGEDPFLISRLVTAETKGIQGEGVIATAKHYAENNQENQRQTINVNVDERTLHEMELRGFEAAVRQGHAGSVMCSYNSVNGKFACENPTLLTDILRHQWGFRGFVVSDYGANHSAGPALQAGLDIEFFGTHFHELKALIQSGAVPVAALDAAVRHILTTMARFGLLAHASPNGGTVVNRPNPPFPLLARRPAGAPDRRGRRRPAEEPEPDAATRPSRPGLARGDRDDRPDAAGRGRRQLPVLGVQQREISPLDALRQQAGARRARHVPGRPRPAGRRRSQVRAGTAERGARPARPASDEHRHRRDPDRPEPRLRRLACAAGGHPGDVDRHADRAAPPGTTSWPCRRPAPADRSPSTVSRSSAVASWRCSAPRCTGPLTAWRTPSRTSI